jgi:hypothetical protein
MQQRLLLPLLVFALVLGINTVVAHYVEATVYWDSISNPDMTEADLNKIFNDNGLEFKCLTIAADTYARLVPLMVVTLPGDTLPEAANRRLMVEGQDKTAELRLGSERRLARSCPKDCTKRKNIKTCAALGCGTNNNRRRLAESRELLPIDIASLQEDMNGNMKALGDEYDLVIEVEFVEIE